MKKFVEYVRAAFVWTNAIGLASKAEYETALAKLNSISSVYSGRRVRYHVLRGFLELATDSFSGSIEDFLMAKRLLEESNSYTEDDKNYLNCYISTYGNLSQSYLDAGGAAPFPPPDYTNVDLDKVRGFLKSQFPLNDHPDWGKDRKG